MKATLKTAVKKMAPVDKSMTVPDKIKILAMHLSGKTPAEISRAMGFDEEWCSIVAHTFSSDREFVELARKVQAGQVAVDTSTMQDGLGSAGRG